jgi:two-component system sensor histidine kinase DegS
MGGYVTELWWEIKKKLVSMTERNRLASQLHDGLAQNIASIILRLELCKKFVEKSDYKVVNEELNQGINETKVLLRKLRESIYEIRTADPEKDLISSFKEIVEELKKGYAFEVRLEFQGQERKLPIEVKDTLRNILKEALVNSIKHSKATLIEIKLIFDKIIKFVYTDNGIGFDFEKIRERSKAGMHFGLQLMEERSKKIGAKFNLKTAPKEGVRIEIEIS